MLLKDFIEEKEFVADKYKYFHKSGNTVYKIY